MPPEIEAGTEPEEKVDVPLDLREMFMNQFAKWMEGVSWDSFFADRMTYSNTYAPNALIKLKTH